MLTTTQIKSIKTGILSDVGPHRGLRLNATSAVNAILPALRLRPRAGQSHEATRVRERVLRGAAFRRFKSTSQAQRFLDVHAEAYNSFNLGRNLLSAKNCRMLRDRAFAAWEKVVAV